VDQYSIRPYRDGDEEEAARLFNQRYLAYGGFVPRTGEYWLWSCLHRPDVSREGIFFVSEDRTQRVCGYAAVGTTGDIWEFCADCDEEHVSSMLLKEIARYIDSLGISSMNINVPNDKILCKVLAQEGFSRVPADKMFVSTMSLVNLLSKLSADKKLGGSKEINFMFDNVPFGVEKIVSVKVHDGEVSIAEGSSKSANVTVKMEFASFLSILFGTANVRRELIRGKMRVKPFWKITKVTGFLHKIRLQNAWYWPLSDYG
jgi:putative sterol carrier protein